MSDKFMLQGHTPVEAPDLMTWARWFETADRHIALTEIGDGVKVSTVFLGLDHSFGMGDGPLLFETMIFGGAHDGWQDRYRTWAEAVSGHAQAVALARASLTATERHK